MRKFPVRLMCENVEATVTPLTGRSFLPKLQEIVAGAQYGVDVIEFQWNFYPHHKNDEVQKFNQNVLKQIRNGIKYRVLLNVEGGMNRLSRINQQTKYNLESVGAHVKMSTGGATAHAKLWIVDHDHVILGSHNISKRSVSRNDECSVLISNRTVVKEYRRYFELLWGRG